MKFGQKLILIIISILSIILGVSRYFVIKDNFWHSSHNAYSQNWNKHILEKYMIESSIVKNIQDGREVTDEILTKQIEDLHNYTSDASEQISLYSEDYSLIYSNFDKISDINIKQFVDENSTLYACQEVDGSHYMFFSVPCKLSDTKVYLVNSYNVDYLYKEKNRQIKDFLIRDSLVIAFSFAIVEVVFVLVSKHIRNLNLLMRQKDDFITGFTHELKTPMTVIMGYSDMLRLKKCDEELEKKALNYIYSESKRLENLSQKLLRLMSISNEKIELKSTSVEEIVEKVANNIVINSKIQKEIESANVLSDADLLEVVIRNLVQNADRAEPKDGTIIVKGQKLGNKKYRILVIDTGKGIPKEHIPRITEDFYMVDKSRSRQSGGSGIGLSLVCKVLNAHKSKLVIESQENVGTTIYFDLKEAQNED